MRMGPAAVLVAAGVLATAGSAAADDLSVPSSQEALTVTFANGVAPVTLDVTNSGAKPAPLSIKYISNGASIPTAATATGDFSLVGPTAKTIGGASAAVITLTFHRSADTPAVKGALVISANGSVLTIPVTEATGFVQSAETISATSWLGPISRTCRWFAHSRSCPGQHYADADLTVEAAGAVPHSTAIGGANGKNLTLTLGTGDDNKHAVLQATGIPGPSSYTGTIVLDPSASTPQPSTVTVHARDALIWALAAIALGVAVSYFLTGRRDPRRAMQGLRASLLHGATPYLDSPFDPDRPDRHYLDDLFLVAGDGRPLEIGAQCPTEGPRPEKAFPLLYWRTQANPDADGRATLAADVSAMAARFARWKQLNDAFLALKPIADPLPEHELIHTDAMSRLDLAQGEPADDDETKTRVESMTAFAFLAHVYSDALAAWRGRSDEWREHFPKLNPVSVYADSKRGSPDELEALRLHLLRIRYQIATSELPKGAGDANLVERVDEPDESVLIAPTVGPARPAFQDEAAIRKNVREWDRVVFWVVSGLTALVYTIGFYAGKDWGSPTDYLLAFASGATIPTVVNWALLPSMRTLTSKS
jgi:hypothetical protein